MRKRGSSPAHRIHHPNSGAAILHPPAGSWPGPGLILRMPPFRMRRLVNLCGDCLKPKENQDAAFNSA